MRAHSCGLSLPELLAAMALGLFIIGSAGSMVASQLQAARQMAQQVRITQDLRGSMDLLVRDLRRASYWGNSTAGVTVTSTRPSILASPYSGITPTVGSPVTQISYSYSQDSKENNLLDSGEQFGFRLDAGTIKFQLSATNTQTLSDDKTVLATELAIAPQSRCLMLQSYCRSGIASGCSACMPDERGCPTRYCSPCPVLVMRSFDIRLQARDANDSGHQRGLQQSSRVRNEQLVGSCS